ncbi:MAG: hypothetical protein IPN13_07230 [Bacteroidetes bacterium]|nr:hypothetical protein [Bacteroidota bacterium]
MAIEKSWMEPGNPHSMSWLATYALILRLQGQNISLTELVALAHVLNDHICYDEFYHRSPIVIRHLHFVINNVWAIIQQINFSPLFIRLNTFIIQI